MKFNSEIGIKQPGGERKAQVCKAPHPAVSFGYFVATLVVLALVAYLVWKLR